MLQININVQGDAAVKTLLTTLSAREIAKASSMAINKTVAKAKAEINRAITARYQLPRAEVSNSVTSAGATSAKPSATISIFGSTNKRGRSLNLIHFAEKKVTLAEGRRRAKAGTQNQLRYNIIRGQGGKMIPGSFIGNQGRTIFIREGKARLPIKPVQVIGVGQMFNFQPIRQRVTQKINTDFQAELTRAIARITAGKTP